MIYEDKELKLVWGPLSGFVSGPSSCADRDLQMSAQIVVTMLVNHDRGH